MCNLDSYFSFLEKSRVLGLGIRKRAVGIQNPTNNWNPESKLHSFPYMGRQSVQNSAARVIACLRKSDHDQINNTLLTVPFVNNFRSLSTKFPTIF